MAEPMFSVKASWLSPGKAARARPRPGSFRRCGASA